MVSSQNIAFQIYIILVFFTVLKPNIGYAGRKYTKEDLVKLREEVRDMFNHAYSGYLKYAYPYDELRPLTCDGVDTWGSYSLTLIDALDTLAVMGNYSEFRRVVDIVTSKANFDANINVSVFETNIRIVGGLLSAHMLSQRAGLELEPGWPCNGPLLRLAEDVAKRLIAAFDTLTGMPYGTVNLRHGVPPGETSVTCTAGVGTYILEFGTLSRLTGDPIYEEVALNALHALYHHRSSIGLYGNHIDVMTGRWTAQDSGIGAGVDSFFEYLVKGALLVQRPELMVMFNEGRVAIDKYLKRNDWYLWVSMHKGQVTLPVFQSLEAYWPGVLSLIGDISAGMKSMHNYHQVWKQYGFTPEFYNIAQGQVGTNRESYPLRPELIESTMYLYRATGDPFLLDVGTDILRSIQHSARTKCGYATIKDCRDHRLENRMESFFLAETTKYLYLLFDTDNFIHNDGHRGLIHTLPSGRECILDAGGYIFNTEAHPMDPGALLCCSENNHGRKLYNTKKSRGEKLTSFTKSLQESSASGVEPQTTEHGVQDLLNKLPSTITNEKSVLKTVGENEENGDVVDVVKVPPPSEEEIQPIGNGLNVKSLSLNLLEMIETLMNTNLKNRISMKTWSRDLLKELVKLIENAEIHRDKNTDINKKTKPNEEIIETRVGELSSENNKQKAELSQNKDVSPNVSFFKPNNVNDFSADNSEKTNTNKNNKIQLIQYDENENVISHVRKSSLSKTAMHSDFSVPKQRNDPVKDNQLFDKIIVQQFKTIKGAISAEADVIMLHLKKCIENLELTKDLAEVAVENDLESQFFTKRLEVRILAMQLTKSLEETRKLLHIEESEKTITLEYFKNLVESVIDRKTVNKFFDEYFSCMELSKKLIIIGKEKYRNNVEYNYEDKSFNTSENGLNESEEIKHNYDSDDSTSSVQNDNWKADDISYQVDDRERVAPVSKVDSGPLFSDKLAISSDDIVDYLSKSSTSIDTSFNPQMLLERIRANPRYYRNTTWMTQYELLTCLPQPYLTRIMLSGEFYNDER